jgi:hypothetical protein
MSPLQPTAEAKFTQTKIDFIPKAEEQIPRQYSKIGELLVCRDSWVAALYRGHCCKI